MLRAPKLSTHWLLLAFGLLALVPAACNVRPPLEVTHSFRSDPELDRQRPADIAVLPVQDAAAGQPLETLGEVMWDTVSRSLVLRGYSPLGRAHVLSEVRAQNLDLTRNIVDADVLRQAAGRFGEDAALAVRVVRWDESSLRTTYRVGFRTEALLLSSLGGKVLWSGVLEGSVKAGGAGPAPRDFDAARRSCAEEMLKELITYLPVRMVR